MKVNITSNADKIADKIANKTRRQIPFATAKALTSVAYQIRERLVAIAPAEMDRPTPFTTRGFKYQKATKAKQKASVYIPAIQAEYMKYQVDGGTRYPKKRAIPVPTKSAKLNAYGNMTRGYVRRLIENKARYFSGTPKGGNRSAGIWERFANNHKIRPLVLWEDSAVYVTEDGFAFYDISKKEFKQIWRTEFSKALADAIRTAKI